MGLKEATDSGRRLGWAGKDVNTHTHTHTERERARGRRSCRGAQLTHIEIDLDSILPPKKQPDTVAW